MTAAGERGALAMVGMVGERVERRKLSREKKVRSEREGKRVGQASY
jgi:hypothetical protein